MFDESKVGIPRSAETLDSELLRVDSKASEETNIFPVSARPTRSTQPIMRFKIDEYKNLGHSASVAAANVVEPLSVSKVECSANRDDWIAAVECEYEGLTNNET